MPRLENKFLLLITVVMKKKMKNEQIYSIQALVIFGILKSASIQLTLLHFMYSGYSR